ncbi:hypothetical protein ACI65C_011642 [Semiaphis heraclei]
MLNIHINLEKVKKSEQYPFSDYSKLNNKQVFDQICMELNIPSIPFVSLATSEVFHDTLMEIGSNVTDKIAKSSKTLKDTLNNLTASSGKNDLVPYEISNTINRSDPPSVDESEVDVSNYKLDLEHREKLNLLPILKICKKLQNGYKLDVDCLQQLCTGVCEVKSNLENVVQVKQPMFPFQQYLKEKHFNTIKTAVNNSFISNLVGKWAEIHTKDILIINKFEYPEFLTYYLDENDFKKDTEVSEFITLFGQVMEVGSIFHFLMNSNLKCSYAIFCKILKMSSNNIEKTEEPLLMYLNSIFVILNNQKNHLCKCGFPLGSVDGKFKKLGKILIDYLSSADINLEQLHILLHKFVKCDVTTNSLEDVIKCFCKQVPHFWPVVLKSDLNLNSSKHIKIMLAIHLGLVDQLDVHLINKNELLFDKLFTLNHYFKNGLCLNCGNIGEKNQGITWTDLTSLAFQYLNHEETRSLLFKHRYNIPCGDIDNWFYQSFILTQLIDLNSKKILINTLQHHNNISTISTENCKNIFTSLEEEVGRTIQFKNQYSKKSHWGLQIDLKNGYCIWCSLPLNSDPLIRGKNNGLVSFRCGHSFHTFVIHITKLSYSGTLPLIKSKGKDAGTMLN